MKSKQENHPANTKWQAGTVALTAMLCCAMPSLVHANDIPEMSVFANAYELPDSVLGETRGKFVSAGQIMNFGVQMVTEWITASGEVINATGNLAINMSGGTPVASFQPVISVHQVSPASYTGSGTNNIVSGGEGLNNVTGVVQSIQVAGNANGIGNGIGISVKRYDENTSNTVNGSNVSQLNVTTPGGNNANVSLVGNGISVAVGVANQGQAMQSIRSISQGSGQVLQSVRLGGDLNQIRNMINLDIQTRVSANNASLNATQMLTTLKQLAPVSTF